MPCLNKCVCTAPACVSVQDPVRHHYPGSGADCCGPLLRWLYHPPSAAALHRWGSATDPPEGAAGACWHLCPAGYAGHYLCIPGGSYIGAADTGPTDRGQYARACVQGKTITSNPAAILMIIPPLALQTYAVFALAFWGAHRLRLPFDVAAPAAFIASSNFFELGVGVAISAYGLDSGATLVNVVGVLVEVRDGVMAGL